MSCFKLQFALTFHGFDKPYKKLLNVILWITHKFQTCSLLLYLVGCLYFYLSDTFIPLHQN